MDLVLCLHLTQSDVKLLCKLLFFGMESVVWLSFIPSRSICSAQALNVTSEEAKRSSELFNEEADLVDDLDIISNLLLQVQCLGLNTLST